MGISLYNFRLNLGKATMIPMDVTKEVKRDGKVINLDGCQWKVGKGYICHNDAYQKGHICLSADMGKSHYYLKPMSGNHSIITQITQDCICMRSKCKKFVGSEFYAVPQSEGVNTCL